MTPDTAVEASGGPFEQMPKLRHFLAVSFLLGSATIRAEAPQSGPGLEFFGRPVRAVEYVADQPLERSHLDPVVSLPPGLLLTRSSVKQAIQALYDTGRFSGISVEAVAEGEGVVLRFNLTLNYYFNRFSLEGDVRLGRRSLWELLSLPVGERFTSGKLEETRRAVLKLMQDRGYLLAEIDARTTSDPRTRQVDTVFVVRPGGATTVRALDVLGVPDISAREIGKRVGFREGSIYDRQRLRRRLESLKQYFVRSGYLAATAEIGEDFRPSDNTVGVTLSVANFGRVRVAVDGFKIEKDRLRRLLPILTGEGLQPDLLEEGARNIKEYVEERGYPEAKVGYQDELDKSGGRVLHYRIEPGRRVTVAYVGFRGNRAISEQELLGTIQIQPSRFLQPSAYSATRLDADVAALHALYQSRGYLGAVIVPLIEPVKGAQKLRIIFECDEGPLSRTKSLQLTGNAGLSTGTLESSLALRVGAPYSPYLAERDRQALQAAYNDAGFLQARVNSRPGAPDEHHAHPVVFDIQEGIRSYVAQVVILGNERTRRSVIEHRVTLKPDEPLSLGKMLQSQQALHNLGIFDLVRVSPQNPEGVAPFQNVVVRVQESKQLTLRYGAGYQERERFRGTVELSDFNIFGTGQRADLRVRGSRIEQGAALTFQQPQIRFLPVNSYFTASLRKKREVSFDVTRGNLSYQYSRPLGGHTWALLRYSYNNVRVSTTDIPAPDRENQPRNISTFSFIYVNDTRDNYLDPEKGFFTSTDLGLTPKWLSQRSYLTLYTQNGYYRRLARSLLLAAGLKIGAARSLDFIAELPISERFFAGGGASLRGFETDRAGPLFPGTDKPQGGNALVVGNLELRTPLWRAIHVAGFYDSGNVFSRVGDIRFGAFSHTVGAGIRIKTPFGPLRADYGVNLNLPSALRLQGLSPRNLFITIGPPF